MSQEASAALSMRVRERYPSLSFGAEDLLAAAREREIDLDSRHMVDVALCLALGQSDPAALAIFEDEIVPVLHQVLHRFSQSDDFRDECIQRVRVKLFTTEDEPARILEYRGRGALAAWIQIIALREAQMILRRDKRVVSDDELLLQLADSDPFLRELRAELKEHLAAALREALETLEPRQRTLLRMGAIDGASSSEIGKVYGVHRATVFRWLREARECVLSETRTRFQARAKISDSEVDSLMRSLAPSLCISW